MPKAVRLERYGHTDIPTDFESYLRAYAVMRSPSSV
jgi:hypothetical protein